MVGADRLCLSAWKPNKHDRILVKVKKPQEKSAGGILLAPTMGKQRCV